MKQSESDVIHHPIPPTFDEHSRVLVLGSFPSVKSREAQYFYGHPQNRFWKVMAAVFSEKFPRTMEERKKLLLRNRVAVWDVIASCSVRGSLDTSIQNVTPNDLHLILGSSLITAIFTNGKKADELYKAFQREKTGISSVCLPSTSPANASWSLERLIEAWRIVAQVVHTDNSFRR